MRLLLEAEIDSKGIIEQMEKVKKAEVRMRQEMDKMMDMIGKVSVKETKNSGESPEFIKK